MEELPRPLWQPELVAIANARGDRLTVAPRRLEAEMAYCFVQRGALRADPALRARGVDRVRQVFRYDFLPLFARLHDSSKEVAVVDAETRRVRFASAPRTYRVLVRLRLELGTTCLEKRASLVLRKTGLERLVEME